MFRAWILLLFTVTIAGCSGVDWFPTLGPDSPASHGDVVSGFADGQWFFVTITATVKKADGTPVRRRDACFLLNHWRPALSTPFPRRLPEVQVQPVST